MGVESQDPWDLHLPVGGAVLVSSRPYPPPRLKGRVAEGGSRAVQAVGEGRKK